MLEADTPRSKDGSYVRNGSAGRASTFREQSVQLPVEPSQFFVFGAMGCPWAHRTIIVHKLMGYGDKVPLLTSKGWWPLSAGLPALATGGWCMSDAAPSQALINAPAEHRAANVAGEPFHYWRLYASADNEYSGRVTCPVLWDAKRATIINNESAEVIRLLNELPLRSLASFAGPDLYPPNLREEIDQVNAKVLAGLNNCVYRMGFATKSDAYEEALKLLKETLQWLEERMASRTHLVGNTLTEADVRAYTTLIRYDHSYFHFFRANQAGRLRCKYPALHAYLRRLYSLPAFRTTTHHTTYPSLYSIICMWKGRRIANTCRIAEVGIFTLMRALAPDTPNWRWRLAGCLSLPLRLLCAYVDPLPNLSLLD